MVSVGSVPSFCSLRGFSSLLSLSGFSAQSLKSQWVQRTVTEVSGSTVPSHFSLRGVNASSLQSQCPNSRPQFPEIFLLQLPFFLVMPSVSPKLWAEFCIGAQVAVS